MLWRVKSRVDWPDNQNRKQHGECEPSTEDFMDCHFCFDDDDNNYNDTGKIDI